MKFLSYLYRFASNFVFLALVYYSLNSMDKYNQRAVVAKWGDGSRVPPDGIEQIFARG